MDLIDDQYIRAMSKRYEFYRDFHSLEQAEQFAELLSVHQVRFKLEKSQTLLDAAIVGHGLVPPVLIKIHPADFLKVNNLLREQALENPAYVDGHYLQQLDDTELIAIVRSPVDWTVEDVAVARQILNNRGIPIPKEHVEVITKKINAELRKGKKYNPLYMLFYFSLILLSGVIFNPFFLLGGIAMGWYYWKDKTVDNQGTKFYTFEKNTRTYGMLIFFLGWISLILGSWFFYNFGINKKLSTYQRTQHFQKESVF